MKEDVWKIDPTRIATFLGCPRAMVQAVAARLYEARIWEEDEVRSEKWFDPETGGVAFVADLMVAEGSLIRRWSEERQQFAYRPTDIRPVSQLAVWFTNSPPFLFAIALTSSDFAICFSPRTCITATLGPHTSSG